MKRLIAILAAVVAASACGSNSATGPTPENIPSFAGSFSGSYAITSCSQSGDVSLADVCGLLGSSASYTFSLTQNGRSVTGSFALGGVAFPATSGSVASDGTLALSATALNGDVSVRVDWVLSSTGSNLGGTLTQRWTASGLSGEANVSGRISNSARTSGMVPTPSTTARSLPEVGRAIAVR